MKRLALPLVLLLSVALADPMPDGSAQAAAVVKAANGFFQDWPPEVDRPGVQVMCVLGTWEVFVVMYAVDHTLIGEKGLEPREPLQSYIDDSSRFGVRTGWLAACSRC